MNCTAALRRLQVEGPNVDCPRLLIYAQRVLESHPSKPCGSDRICALWETYGILLALLLENGTNTDLWVRLQQRYEEATASHWDVRAGIMRSLCSLAGTRLQDVLPPHGRHFEPFWETWKYCTAYIDAALNITLRHPKSLQSAVAACVELLFKVVLQWPGDPTEDKRLHVTLADASRKLLGFIRRSQVSYEDGLERWNDLLTALTNKLAAPREASVREILSEIANDLDQWRRVETRPEQKANLRIILPNLMWRLHQRRYAGPRIQLPGPVKACELVLLGNFGRIPLKASIEDVCPTTCRGFRIETSSLNIDRRFEKDVGCTSDRVGDYVCREIEGHLANPDRRITARDCEWTVRYHGADSITFSGKIMRAWPLEQVGGTGLALLATNEDGNLAQWGKFVNDSGTAARYSP